jgi:hypothetical protein
MSTAGSSRAGRSTTSSRPETGLGFFGADSGIPGGARYDEVALYDHALSAASVAAHDAAAR